MESSVDTGVSLTPSLLRQHVRAMRELAAGRRPIAIRTTSAWSGPAVLDVDGWSLDVVTAISPLHVRELLTAHESNERGLVLLSPFSQQELGLDVVSRLAGRSLLLLDPWTLVIDAFKARDVDPQLLRYRWMASALLDAMPPSGFAPVAAGVLDSETAWGLVLEGRLGLSMARPDAVVLLAWTADDRNVQRFRSLAGDVQSGVRAWLADTIGPLATAMMEAALTGHAGDAVALGLVCATLFKLQPPFSVQEEAQAAVIRMEALAGGRPIAPAIGAAWATTALTLVKQRGRDERQVRAWLERADAQLGALGASASAWRSEASPRGFEQRCERAAAAIRDALGTTYGSPAWRKATEAVGLVAAHRAATMETALERLDRLQMALRLVGWLSQVPQSPRSLAEATQRHLSDDGFADWARAALRAGDPVQSVAACLDAIETAVRERTQERQRAFATLLAESLALGTSSGALGIERVLPDRLAPAMTAAPVLFLVVDGMSAAVFAELADSFLRDGWIPVSSPGRPAPEPVVSVVPSVTEYCRTTLLTGTLQGGTAQHERADFATHPGLLAVTLPSKPPVLFHKATILEGASGLTDDLRREVLDRERKVVGIVINAVDDHLLKADQVRSRWTLATVPSINAVLHAAREAGRLVAITADHGHVLESGSELQSGSTSDRWRSADTGSPRQGEVLLQGTRVLCPGQRCVAAVDTAVRYRSKKNGYHGGATAQEMIVPLAWFWAGESLPADWHEVTMVRPVWWDVSVATAAPEPQKPFVRDKAPVRAPSRPLLALADPEALLEPSAPPLLEQLLLSELFAVQRAAQARVRVPDERVRQILEHLLARGGRTTRAALAAHLGVAAFRLTGQLAAVRSLLNVEGYLVLAIDEATDTVTLNLDLLRTQFGL